MWIFFFVNWSNMSHPYAWGFKDFVMSSENRSLPGPLNTHTKHQLFWRSLLRGEGRRNQKPLIFAHDHTAPKYLPSADLLLAPTPLLGATGRHSYIRGLSNEMVQPWCWIVMGFCHFSLLAVFVLDSLFSSSFFFLPWQGKDRELRDDIDFGRGLIEWVGRGHRLAGWLGWDEMAC